MVDDRGRRVAGSGDDRGTILVAGQIPPNPAPLGETGRLAYILDGGLYLADWDGRHAIRIGGSAVGSDACEAANQGGDLWSPDGRYLAYRSGMGNPCVPTVHVSDEQGTAIASWTAAMGWTAAWAPDSRRVATWSAVGGIDIHGVDGVLQQRLDLPALACVCGDRDPGWAHDGTAILLRMGMGPGDRFPTEVFRLSIPDGAATRLNTGGIRRIAYSADGTQAAFWADGSLVVTSADDMAARRVDVKTAEINRLVWSPTGDRLAVESNGDLQVLDVPGGSLTTVATARGTDPIQAFAFSADGDRILFRQSDGAGKPSLWIVGTDGSDARELIPGADQGDWQPLGR